MKPIDKAYKAALNAFYMTRAEAEHEPNIVCMRRAVDAAYAAQFKSKDYAGLVERAREIDQYDDHDLYVNAIIITDLADALEALLAERDALKSELIDYKDAAASEADFVNEQAEKIRELKAERDALLARLAPVENKALVEIAATAYLETHSDKITPVRIETVSPYIRAAIAAIRPHIEAAERERCIKAAKGRYEKLVPANEAARNFRLGRMTAAYEIEGKFKPSKTPPDTNTAQIDVREFVEKLDAPQQSGAEDD